MLNMATVESDNPDLRDRGYIYWRLLCANPDVAKVRAPWPSPHSSGLLHECAGGAVVALTLARSHPYPVPPSSSFVLSVD